jgi:glycosyltransferase involved in cell wall biosynthesis
MKDRVLVLTDRYRPESFLINDLVDRWHGEGRRLDVLTQVPSYPQDAVFPGYRNLLYQARREHGIRVFRVRTILGYSRSTLRKVAGYVFFAVHASFAALLLGSRYRTVYVYQTGPLTQALPLFVLKRIYRCRTIIWTQDVWPDTVFAYGLPSEGFGARLLRAFVRFVYRQCDVVHVSSPGFAAALRPYVSRRVPIEYIPQWAPSELYAVRSSSQGVPYPRDRMNFVFAGNLGKVQNLENVIRAVDIVSRKGILLQLNIVGDGSHAATLRSLRRELAVHSVVFWGRKPLADILEWMSGSDFTVLSLTDAPTLSLTIPAKFQAYLVAGRPMLVAARGEVARIVQDEGIGVVCDPEQPSAIAEALIQCCGLSEDARALMSANIDSLAKTRYDRSILQGRITDAVFRFG